MGLALALAAVADSARAVAAVADPLLALAAMGWHWPQFALAPGGLTPAWAAEFHLAMDAMTHTPDYFAQGNALTKCDGPPLVQVQQ